MPLKVIGTANGKSYKMGRRRPIAHSPRLSLERYLKARLAPAPATCDYTGKATEALSQVYLNDELGDCVIACMAHLVGTFTANAGDEVLYTRSQIIALYSAISGYVPGDDSTDNGCDEETALNYWVQDGAPAGRHQIAAWLAVNPADLDEVKQALYLFENLVFGVALPDAWIDPFPSGPGFTWRLAGDSDPENGHCVCGLGYNDKGITIDSWGMLGTITPGAIAKYCSPEQGGQLFTVISQDILARAQQKAPNGLTWSQLAADFDAIGGRLVAVLRD